MQRETARAPFSFDPPGHLHSVKMQAMAFNRTGKQLSHTAFRIILIFIEKLFPTRYCCTVPLPPRPSAPVLSTLLLATPH